MKHRTYLTAAAIALAAALALPAAAGATVIHADEGPHAWLGVVLEETDDGPDGAVRVARVIPDSPAALAGLQDGDVVVAADGGTIDGPRGLAREIRDRAPGDAVVLTVLRDGAETRVTAELAERESRIVWRMDEDDLPFGLDVDPHVDVDVEGLHEHADLLRRHVIRLRDGLDEINGPLHELRFFASRPRLGVQLTEVTPELREHLGGRRDAGVLISRVLEDSPALAAGLEVGDLIEAVDGEPVRDAGDLIRSLPDMEGGRITIDVIRDGRPLSFDADIPEAERPERADRPRA